LGNFSYKTTHMLRERLDTSESISMSSESSWKSKLKSITIDIDSSVVNVEGHQEGAVKGYNP
jgi:hypothetical protein